MSLHFRSAERYTSLRTLILDTKAVFLFFVIGIAILVSKGSQK